MKGKGSQTNGGASASQSQEGMPGKGTGRFYHMLLQDSMVLTSTEPQACHCPNWRLSLESGAQKAVLPILALATACGLAGDPGSGQDLGDQPGNGVL